MIIRRLSKSFAVAGQISERDVLRARTEGYTRIICNRPDGEEPDQPPAAVIGQAAERAGIGFENIPVTNETLNVTSAARLRAAIDGTDGPVLAYCRSGARSTRLWQMATDVTVTQHHDVVIVGGGSLGISAAASLLRRRPDLDIAIIEPATRHYYQPGWTMVGAGIFRPEQTMRRMADVLPARARWIDVAASGFAPDDNTVLLADGGRVSYRMLIVAAGIKLDYESIPGLAEALGTNGVTSNYRYDVAPYTWELARSLSRGTALFTQPPMPIKCAGAPQKVMYLSCDTWRRRGVLDEIDVHFMTPAPVLFGVAAYVPALMEYVKRYGIDVHLGTKLVAVDGASRTANFEITGANGDARTEERHFDMLHVCPPQTAPDFIRESPLANAAGWVEVDEQTLQHVRYANVFGAGDVCSATNAKTAAAARAQAPVVAENLLAVLDGKLPPAAYNGYGSCPLTVEHGKIVLAEFGYGGKLLPTFPSWLVKGTEPSRFAWVLKKDILPFVYWRGMLKGREWLL